MRLARLHFEHLPVEAEQLERRASILLQIARGLSALLGMNSDALASCQLKNLAGSEDLPSELLQGIQEFVEEPEKVSPSGAHLRAAHRLGEALDLLLASERGGDRRKLGSYYTPPAVAEAVIERSLSQSSLLGRARHDIRICDPACGGGAFLLEAAAGLERLSVRKSPGMDFRKLRSQLLASLFGIDLSPLAIATTKVALWLYCGSEQSPERYALQFVVGDALLGAISARDEECTASVMKGEGPALDFFRQFPTLFNSSQTDGEVRGFDWIVGNPPWVAFQGRATQRISRERRSFYRKRYRAFTGYPTLHGMFVQRAASLAPRGHISLLLPSSVSDLDGYRNTRACLLRAHEPMEPLLEFGQDAFVGVVQPCFALIASPRTHVANESTRPWVLEERTRSGAQITRAAPPVALESVQALECLPDGSFREMGFQSNRVVVTQLFHRGEDPPGDFSISLLEGRNVGEFCARAPKLYLKPDAGVLKETRCRLRSPEIYDSVDLVVRQTAAFTIAALHRGGAFRNSLIAAFETSEVDKLLLLGLLNSALYRALHLGAQRDARQATFPQVKISHLRRLPFPPRDEDKREVIRKLAAEAARAGGMTKAGRQLLDDAVFDLFAIDKNGADQTRAYLQQIAPNALRLSLHD